MSGLKPHLNKNQEFEISKIMIKRCVPYIPTSDKEGLVSKFVDIIDNCSFIQGKYVSELEMEFAKACGVEYAISTNSGASALEVGIRASGLYATKILVTTNTFAATISAIITSGNTPVLIDIDPTTLCMDIDLAIKYIDEESLVGGVMLVHMAGLISPRIDELVSHCKSNGVLVFEDASHAAGASRDGKMAGNIGDVGIFSLFATKVITSGEGGIITTNNPFVADMAMVLRNHGCHRNTGSRIGVDYGVKCEYVSSNYRMPELSAIIGLSQVKNLGMFVDKRNELATVYRKLINESSELASIIKIPPIYERTVHTYWQYIITITDQSINREDLCSLLYQRGIETANAYYPPCHKQPAFLKYVKNCEFPVADNILLHHIALPMHVQLTTSDVKTVVRELKRCVIELQKS